jgi:3-deoxy-D-arabino-heptulosonate 7-phosphate (DAHP) synthase
MMVCNKTRETLLQRARELLEEISDDALPTATRFLEDMSKKRPADTAVVAKIKKREE